MNKQEVYDSEYKNGLITENNIISKLRNQGYSVEPTDRYEWYDMKINNKYLCEIKSRNIKKDTFDTTILPYSKILEYKKVKKDYEDLIVIFDFKDGQYYTTYKDICKNRCKIKSFQRYKSFTYNPRKHVYIPVTMLQPLNELVLAK